MGGDVINYYPLRSMLPTHASMAFSIDKMVMGITRQLQIFSSNDSDKAHTLNLYAKYKMYKAPYMWDTNHKKLEEDKDRRYYVFSGER